MNRILFSILLITSFAFSQYLQEGLYPDCSYVIVTEDGWKIHKNNKGRILSMLPKDKHDVAKGKYSFDKFGNLIPYIPCNINENDFYSKTDGGFIDSQPKISSKETEVEVEVSLDFGKLFEKFDFSVYGGAMMGFGDNFPGQFPIGMTYGADIKVAQCPIFDRNNITLSLSGMSAAWDGASANYDYTLGWAEPGSWSYDWSNSDVAKEATLSTMGVFVGYKLNLGKIFIAPSVGMLTQTVDNLPFLLSDQTTIVTQSFDGQDNAIKVDVGYNFGKISIYAGGTYSLTSNYHWGNTEQPAVYLNGGLKYNF